MRTARLNHDSEFYKQVSINDGSLICSFCGEPSCAYWVGHENPASLYAIVGVCGICAREILPILFADAVYFRPRVRERAKISLADFVATFWKATLTCLAEDDRDDKARRIALNMAKVAK